MKAVVDTFVPLSMPRDMDSLGFDTPFGVGFGTVGRSRLRHRRSMGNTQCICGKDACPPRDPALCRPSPACGMACVCRGAIYWTMLALLSVSPGGLGVSRLSQRIRSTSAEAGFGHVARSHGF